MKRVAQRARNARGGPTVEHICFRANDTHFRTEKHYTVLVRAVFEEVGMCTNRHTL